MATMTEVRWHGRGGQGAKTAGYILAVAAAEDGWQVQAFPEYGAERRGAPMRSYVRISDGPIRLRSGITNPEIVVVLDPSLLESENPAEGIVEDGIIIVNTSDSPAEIRERLGNPSAQVWTVDASQISQDTIGRNMPNTPMLGALARVSDVLDLEGARQAIRKQLGEKLPENIIQANFEAVQRAYDEVQSE